MHLPLRQPAVAIAGEIWKTEGMSRFDEFRAKVFHTSERTVEWSTAAIVHVGKDRSVVEHRSAILAQIADQRFLVTAAHNLIARENEGTVPFIVMPVKGMAPVPVLGQWFSTTNTQEDLSVCRLQNATIDAIGDHYRYLRISDMKSRTRQRFRHYLLMGFPFDLYEQDEDGARRRGTWKYLTIPVENTDVVTNYDPDLHLALLYERKSKTQDGRKVHPPSMSGCGIWSIEKMPGEEFTDDDLKLVAIETAWHKGEEYVKGTWIDVVLIIIWKYFPSVRAAMRIHGFEYHDDVVPLNPTV